MTRKVKGVHHVQKLTKEMILGAFDEVTKAPEKADVQKEREEITRWAWLNVVAHEQFEKRSGTYKLVFVELKSWVFPFAYDIALMTRYEDPLVTPIFHSLIGKRKYEYIDTKDYWEIQLPKGAK